MKKILYFMAILLVFASCMPFRENENNVVERNEIGICRDGYGNNTDGVMYTVFDINVRIPDRSFVMNDRCVVITIDSCEYLYIDNPRSYTGGTLTHKGNCKYCAERRKKEIEAAVRKSLNQNNHSNYGKSETDDPMSDLW